MKTAAMATGLLQHIAALYMSIAVVMTSQVENAFSTGIEYCQLETFSPACRHGDVIAMTSARFGRMRTGRCIDEGTLTDGTLRNTLGCSADVMEYAHRTCSGMLTCEISVPNRDLLSTRPCPDQLTMYLEASYTCIHVVEEDRSCSVSVTTQPTHILGNRPSANIRGHDSSSSSAAAAAASRRCGSRDHPWMLEAQTGQQISVSLLDFTGGRHVDAQSTADKQMQPSTECQVQYGYVLDKTHGHFRNTSICAGDAAVAMHRPIYTSRSNSLEIVITAPNGNQPASNFLIGVGAVGCSNLVPPTDAWLRRTDTEATIGCYMSRHRWTLRCVDNQWKGTVGSCSPEVQLDADVESEQTEDATDDGGQTTYFIQVLAIVATSFVGLAVCLVIIFIGIGCARRYRPRAMPQKSNPLLVNGDDSSVFGAADLHQLDSAATAAVHCSNIKLPQNADTLIDRHQR